MNGKKAKMLRRTTPHQTGDEKAKTWVERVLVFAGKYSNFHARSASDWKRRYRKMKADYKRGLI